MGKKKAKQMAPDKPSKPILQTFARKMKNHEFNLFEKKRRNYHCLYRMIKERISVENLDPSKIKHQLAYECRNIEQQFIKLRELVCINNTHLSHRRFITKKLLDCLHTHHDVIYEGLIFGSSVNGLGFKDSDVDMRLRALVRTEDGMLQPVDCERALVEETLKNIAYQTTRCTPVSGFFAASSRCPVAKIKLVSGFPGKEELREGMNFDISMLASNSLGTFNSKYIRFLCHIEPKFHLLAIALRYWSKAQDLIVAGHLSSYALTTMLIFFCQNTSPPLLPTVDQMNEAYFRDVAPKISESELSSKKALLRREWNCLISLEKGSYVRSENQEPLCLLLFRFFEFYLNLPYSSKTIISTRTGKLVDYESFKNSSIFHKDFGLKSMLNVQDPFDLKHNVTAGLEHLYFRKLMEVIRITYERLFTEIGKFVQPPELRGLGDCDAENTAPEDKVDKENIRQIEEWGLNAIFLKISKKALNGS